jgi:MFS family permease
MRWLDTIATGAFVLELTGSPFAVALTFFFRMIPMFLFGAYIGAISDRLNRKTILVLVFGIMSAVYLLLAVAVATDFIQVWHVYVGALLGGSVWATDFPVRRAMIGEVVERENLSTAMGLDLATSNFMRVPGPFLGGFLLDSIGMTAVYSMGAGLFLAAMLLGLNLRYKPVEQAAIVINPIRNIIEGVRFIRRDQVIVTVLIVTVVMNMFAFPYQSMVPVIAERTFGVSNTLMGLLVSAEGLGATFGALWVASRATPAHYSRLYFFGSVLFLVMVLLFSRVPWYGVAIPILFAGGFGMSGFGTMQSIIVISATPPEMRGRVLGVLAVTIGTGPVAALAIGAIAESAGAPMAVMLMAITGLALLAVTAILLPKFLRQREVVPLGERERNGAGPPSLPVLQGNDQDHKGGGEQDSPDDKPGIDLAITHSTPQAETSASMVQGQVGGDGRDARGSARR